jgi:surface antigen
MRGWGTGARTLFFGTFFTVASQFSGPQAHAGVIAQHSSESSQSRHSNVRLAVHTGVLHGKVAGHGHYYARGGGLSCVPYARAESGITVAGNAWQWWDNAAGVYARGSVPEAGSVLTFRSNGRMRLGHVAVVSGVINGREIEIDHANWWGPGMRGGVAHNIPVVDVSENNDWTAVRVGLGQSGEFGSVYPTYGFIYDRPDTGVMTASASAPAPQPALNPAPGDLRPVAERGWQTYEEVAEAPPPVKYHGRIVHVVTHKATTVSTHHRQQQQQQD